MMPTRNYDYDVVLSYAQEDRDAAEFLADALSRHNVNVFYDKNEKQTRWDQQLRNYLDDLYQNKARHCVVLLSRSYIANPRTMYELTIARSRASYDTSYLFYVRLDNAVVPDLLAGLYFRIREEEIEEITDIINEGKQEESSHGAGGPKTSQPRDVFTVTPIPDPAGPTNPPKTAPEWLDEGDKHYRVQRYKEALHAYNRAIQLDPTNPRAHYSKSEALKQLRRDDEADEAYRLARQLDSR